VMERTTCAAHVYKPLGSSIFLPSSHTHSLFSKISWARLHGCLALAIQNVRFSGSLSRRRLFPKQSAGRSHVLLATNTPIVSQNLQTPGSCMLFVSHCEKPGNLLQRLLCAQKPTALSVQNFWCTAIYLENPAPKTTVRARHGLFSRLIKRSIAAPRYCLAPRHVPSLPRASFRKWHCKAPMNSKTITRLYMSQNRKPILTARHVEVRRVSEMSNQYWREHGYMCAWHVRLGDEV
jgi:hypothetical protein